MRSNRLRWIVLGIAAVAFCAAGLSHISFNIEILKLLPSRLPQVEGLTLFLKHFAQPNELIITVEASTADEAEARADAIAAALAPHTELVKRALSRAPWEKDPAGLAELLAYLVINQPPEKVQELVAKLAPD